MSNHSTRSTTRHAGRHGLPMAALLAALLLSACGGGGGSGGSTTFGSGVGGATTDVVDPTKDTNGVGTATGPTPTAPSALTLVKADPADKSIVLQGQGGNGRTETATLTFKLTDTNGNALIGKTVKFSTTATNVTLNTDSAVTDKDGLAVTSVNSKDVPTSFRVLATVPGTAPAGGKDISTMSDTILVTTGIPVQSGFSLSVTTYNFRGWDYESTPDKPASHINVLIADKFGNPVADGTPVAFQTNMGSIGTSDRGGCVTKNGGCSVDLRAQDPRIPTPNQPATPCNTGTGATPDATRRGVATICASTTDGTNTLTGLTYVTFSGSSPEYLFVNSNNTGYRVGIDPIDLVIPSASGGKATLDIELDDINFNALPKGTTISLGQTDNVSGSYSLTLPNIPPDAFSNNTRQGTRHSITVKSNAAGASAAAGGVCQPSSGGFTLDVTVPAPDGTDSLITHIPITLTFSCP